MPSKEVSSWKDMPTRKQGTTLVHEDLAAPNTPLDGANIQANRSVRTPRILPPLARGTPSTSHPSNNTPRSEADFGGNGAVLNTNLANTQRTTAFIRTPDGTQRNASLLLSRAATKIPQGNREKIAGNGNEGSDGEWEGVGNEEEVGDVVPDLPVITKVAGSQVGLSREFTFTGYDIMADGPCSPPVKNGEELQRERQLVVYHAMCRQLGVIPVSFIERKILSPEIRMRSHGLGSNGARALAVTLVENNKVRYLDVADNNIGMEGAKAIAEMLTRNNTIEELNLAENYIGYSGGFEICRTVRKKDKMKKLNLSGNKLRDDESSYLADLLKNNTRLRELSLSHNEIGENGAVLLGKALTTNDTLEVLDLSWNHIRGHGAEALAYGLSRNSGLRVLNVSWNGFGREGCVAMGSALATNSCLIQLDMRCNRVYMDDMAALLKGLEQNTTLATLRLAMNPITPEGALLLLRKLEKMEDSAIKDLDLKDTVVNSEFIRLLGDLRQRRVLRVRHGVSIRHSRSPITDDTSHGIFEGDPRALVFKMMEKDGLRVVDLFNRLDDDNSLGLTRDEFKHGILGTGLAITEDQLDRIIDMMDTDGDGSVDLGELIAAERDFKRRQRARRRHMAVAAARERQGSFSYTTPRPASSTADMAAHVLSQFGR